MNTEARRRLNHALDACRATQTFTAGRTLVDYESDLMLRSAVERQFEIIGEAMNYAHQADETVEDIVPDLRVVIGSRKRIIHGYEKIDNTMIWSFVTDEVSVLAQQIEMAL